MIGMERNSDIVKMASFAPLFEHYDMAQWSVCLATGSCVSLFCTEYEYDTDHAAAA